MYYLAGDIGGTKALMGLAQLNAQSQLEWLPQRRYECANFSSLAEIINTFFQDSQCTANDIKQACFGLPGPVQGEVIKLTNLPWQISRADLLAKCGLSSVDFINDFHAAAQGINVLTENQLFALYPKQPAKPLNANRLVVGAGTGLGVAPVFYDGQHFMPQASEGGHFDFAPISETQQLLLNWLWQRWNHVSYERVLCGAGLETLYEFFTLHDVCNSYELNASQKVNKCRVFNAQNAGMGLLLAEDQESAQKNLLKAFEIADAAEKGDKVANKALLEFVTIYGAFIGAAALVWRAENGIYLAGGIAEKILPWMQHPFFVEAYLEKGRMSHLLQSTPVFVVQDHALGLKGAMDYAITQ